MIVSPGFKRRFAGALALSGSVVAGILFALGPVPASAQSKTESEAFSYQGTDRQKRLLEGARKEGELTVYTSAPLDYMVLFTAAFEKKYGIKVKLWRSGSDKVLQRTVTEAQAQRFDVDVVETNGPQLESLHREKLLQEIKSPYLSHLIPQAIQPHHEWVGTRVNIFALAYNTQMIKKEDLPTSYQDLLNPKWKGRLGIEAEVRTPLP